MQAMFENVAVLLIFGLTGWFLGKRHILSSQNLRLLSVLEVWVFLPCNSLRSFSRNFTVEYFQTNYNMLLVSIAVLAVLVAINAWSVPKFVKDPYRQNVMRYSLTMPNYGYVGYALVQGVYGDLMLMNAQMFALPMSIYINTEGYRMLTNTGKVSWKKILNPSLVAMFVGAVVGLTGWGLPSVVANVVDKGSACMGPISMLLAVTLGRVLDPTTVLIMVVLYACPCGLNTIVYPRLIGEDCRLGASLAMISTVGSLATLPLCMKVLELILR